MKLRSLVVAYLCLSAVSILGCGDTSNLSELCAKNEQYLIPIQEKIVNVPQLSSEYIYELFDAYESKAESNKEKSCLILLKAELLSRAGYPEKGRTELDNAITVYDRNHIAYQKRSFHYELENNISRAISDAKIAVELCRSCHRYWANLALLYESQGDAGNSIFALSKSIELASQEASYYELRGDVYSALGEGHAAFCDYQKFLVISKKEEPKFDGIEFERIKTVEMKLKKLRISNADSSNC